jgi:hypothetical protein
VTVVSPPCVCVCVCVCMCAAGKIYTRERVCDPCYAKLTHKLPQVRWVGRRPCKQTPRIKWRYLWARR